MAFRIKTNVPSLSSRRHLSRNNQLQQESLGRLASGSRINKSADDAAGLAISEKMKSTIRSTNQAERNAQDGISLLQTAEGGLGEVSSLLTRLRELSIQSASDTIGDEERSYTDLEYQNLKEEIQRISQVTEFNGKKLLSGEGDTYDFQIGIRNDPDLDRISYDAAVVNSTADNLGIAEIGINTKEGARSSLQAIDYAISQVSAQRAEIGALQNRLSSTIQNLQVSAENMSAANSRIRDTDYAKETAINAQQNILSHAGTSVLSQANAQGQMALKLLG